MLRPIMIAAAAALVSCGPPAATPAAEGSAVAATTESRPVPDLPLDKAWTVDGARSALKFSGVQNGDAFEGRFERFSAAIAFDPDELQATVIEVAVDLSSAKTGDRQRDAAMPGPDWFDVKANPTATFRSTEVVATGEGSFEARGELNLRGVSRPVALPFTLTIDGETARAVGEATLVRTDFGVGQGEFATGKWVGLDVKVSFEIVASR